MFGTVTHKVEIFLVADDFTSVVSQWFNVGIASKWTRGQKLLNPVILLHEQILTKYETANNKNNYGGPIP